MCTRRHSSATRDQPRPQRPTRADGSMRARCRGHASARTGPCARGSGHRARGRVHARAALHTARADGSMHARLCTPRARTCPCARGSAQRARGSAERARGNWEPRALLPVTTPSTGQPAFLTIFLHFKHPNHFIST